MIYYEKENDFFIVLEFRSHKRTHTHTRTEDY